MQSLSLAGILFIKSVCLTVKGLAKTAKTRTFSNWLIDRSILVSHISEVFLESLKFYNTSLSNINSIYAHSLLQDVGSIGMLQVIDNYQQDVMAIKLADDTKSWSDAENMLYGFDHNRIGEHILLESQLPLSFSVIARYHHNPDYSTNPKVESKKISLVRLAPASLIDTRKFSEHEPFGNYNTIEETGLVKEYDDFSEKTQEEFLEQLGLTSDIYNEIKTTKLTDDFLNNISQFNHERQRTL